MERTKKRAVHSCSKGAELCCVFLRAEDDLKRGKATDMGVLGYAIQRAMEQDMFLCMPMWAVQVCRDKLGVVRVRIWAKGIVICSLSEVIGVVGVERVVGHPLEDGG